MIARASFNVGTASFQVELMSENLKIAEEPSGLSANGEAFLRARGLNTELCERLGLTSGPGRGGIEWLVIPYERKGQRVNRKFRRIDQKQFMQDKGGEQIFWRHDCIADEGLADQPLVITEGEFDAIAAIQAGFWRTVSIPAGAPQEALQGEARASGKYAFIEAARPALDKIKRIVICADADGPGAALLSDLTALLGPSRCAFASYPDGCKDLNDVLREHGEQAVAALLKDAKWVRVVGVHRLLEMPPLPPLELWRPDVHEPIDDLVPICPGQVSVWTGIPGHGKSSLLNAIAWSMAKRDGLRIAHGSFEMQPQREYLNACISYFSGEKASAATEEQVHRMKLWINNRITFLVADGYAGPGEEEYFDADLAWFFDAARTAVIRDGCRLVILDPWSQIEHAKNGNEAETTYIQRSIRRARTFARTFDVHVAIVAHPTKMRRLEDGSYAMPEGYEISGSAHWFNGVDMGVTCHRDPPLIEDTETGDWVPDPHSTRVLVRVWKKKTHSIMGKPGDAYASFNSDTGRYSSAEHWEERTYRRGQQGAPQARDEDE